MDICNASFCNIKHSSCELASFMSCPPAESCCCLHIELAFSRNKFDVCIAQIDASMNGLHYKDVFCLALSDVLGWNLRLLWYPDLSSLRSLTRDPIRQFCFGNSEFGLPNSLKKRGVQDGLKKRTILRFFFLLQLLLLRGINFVLVVAVSSFLCQGGVLVIVISIGILSLV